MQATGCPTARWLSRADHSQQHCPLSYGAHSPWLEAHSGRATHGGGNGQKQNVVPVPNLLWGRRHTGTPLA